MTKPRYTEERFMPILWTLYQRTSNGNEIVKYGDFCREFNISNCIFPILERHKVLVSTSLPSVRGMGRMQKVYVWNTFQPNIHMAKKLMEELKKISKASAEKQREKREMLKKQQELEMTQNQELQQPEVNYEVVDVHPLPSSVVVKQEDLLKHSTEPIQLQNPFQPIKNPFQTVTLSSDQASQVIKKAKTKKKFSIAWGLISIEW
jgi:hypothetical protein